MWGLVVCRIIWGLLTQNTDRIVRVIKVLYISSVGLLEPTSIRGKPRIEDLEQEKNRLKWQIITAVMLRGIL